MQIDSNSKAMRPRNDEDVELMEQVQSITSLDESKGQENVRLKSHSSSFIIHFF